MTENEMVKCNTDSMDMSLNKLQGIVKAGKPGVLQSKGLSRIFSNTTVQKHQLSNSMKLSHALWGHPRWEGHGGEV